MWLPFIVGLTAQLPFVAQPTKLARRNSSSFVFKEDANRFSPRSLVELGRPGTGRANDPGDLVIVSYAQYNLTSKEDTQSVFIVPAAESTIKPLEIPLMKGDRTFWLDGKNLAHAIQKENKLDIYVLGVEFQVEAGILNLKTPGTLIGSIPTTTASNFRYVASSQYLVFSDCVYKDGNLSTVKEQNYAWENRGNSALVYDSTYERHWNTWEGPKTLSLFSVRLQKDQNQNYALDSEFTNVLKGTGHTTPVEPFGGINDFDVSKDYIIYTAKDPELPQAMHTRQNIYIVDISGNTKPRELTSGKQGATHSPVFNPEGSKAAWLELDTDEYESDRAKIVVYDIATDVRYTLAHEWDRSPDTLAFSKDGDFIYFTAGDHARVKTFVLPIPPTPKRSTRHPDLAKKYTTPVLITDSGTASGLQTLPCGRILITKSSFIAPNDLYLVSGLVSLENKIRHSDDIVSFNGQVSKLTNFTQVALNGKQMSVGEEFWFKGANNVDVQGWVLKPYGWRTGQKKKYPVLLAIHGGPQGAWGDQWWNVMNFNVVTGQGYFVVAINPSGSTTFGQKFSDAIRMDWGGKPFVDLRLGWKHVLENYPEINPDCAVAAGGSWGGYAINWIQGHPEFGFNFKALASLDGIFDVGYVGYSTDELFSFNYEWGGRPWEKQSAEIIERFNPSTLVHKWSVPELIIHGSKDYRLPETESIAPFHALQQLGIPSRLVIFPDEDHSLSLRHGNSLKLHHEIFRWFDEFVGDH